MLDKLILGAHNEEYAEKLAAMSDDELFDEMIDRSVPDDYDGAFTGWGQFLQEYSEVTYRERMGYSYYPSNYALFNHLMWPKGNRYEYMTS